MPINCRLQSASGHTSLTRVSSAISNGLYRLHKITFIYKSRVSKFSNTSMHSSESTSPLISYSVYAPLWVPYRRAPVLLPDGSYLLAVTLFLVGASRRWLGSCGTSAYALLYEDRLAHRTWNIHALR